MNGTVTIRYRPLETMDRLHVLLAESATLENSSVDYMESLFSLPSSVIRKECAILEGYGIGQTSDGYFRLTDRGVEVLTTWNLLGKTDSVEIETSAKEWSLGPGSFRVPGTIRDFRGCKQLAKQHGVTTKADAKKFIGKRQAAEIELEIFLEKAPKTWHGGKHKWTSNAEAIIGKISVAESNDAIDDLRDLLHSLFKRHDDKSDKFKEQRDSLLDKFNKRANEQRRENRRFADVKISCESLLLREWLSRSASHLLERFEDEPGAFAFDSSVEVALETYKPKTKTRLKQNVPKKTRTSPKEPPKSEGLLRSLFRWFTG